MTLHEYVAAFCPEGPRQLRRLVHERTGVQLKYSYVWKWCNLAKPCSLSFENASLVHAATDGACTMQELQSVRKLASAVDPKPARQKPAKVTKRKKRARSAQRAAATKLRKKIRELERQIAAFLKADATRSADA